jgi:DNA-binding GntR family transcriptional regulator
MNELLVQPLDRSTTGAQVAHAVREMILDGSLEPGTHLREQQLAHALGVSRNTLREALRSLVEQGLLTHHPHRGVVVTDLVEADVDDLFRMRGVLEGAGLATIDGDGIAALARSTDAFAAALAVGDIVGALEHDFAFHRVLVDALGSARLSAAHARAQGELRLVMLQLDRDYEPPQVAEHRAIVDALTAGDVKRAIRALDDHLARANQRLQFLVRMKESETPAKGAPQ